MMDLGLTSPICTHFFGQILLSFINTTSVYLLLKHFVCLVFQAEGVAEEVTECPVCGRIVDMAGLEDHATHCANTMFG